MTPGQLNTLLGDVLAPWVQDLGVRVTDTDTNGWVSVRMPPSGRLSRSGGTVCGQALAAAADTAALAAICHASGGWVPMATIGQFISFERPIADTETVLLLPVVQTLTRRHAFVRVQIHAGAADPAGHAHLTYALSPPRAAERRAA